MAAMTKWSANFSAGIARHRGAAPRTLRLQVTISPRLTAREREILDLVAGGDSNHDIAAKLFISEKTVGNHLTGIFDKLGVSSRSQAIVFARDRGMAGRPN